MAITNIQLVWIRNDIRLDDNPAIYYAAKQGNIELLYCDCSAQDQIHNESSARRAVKQHAINAIFADAGQLGINCHLLKTPYYTDVSEAILKLCQTRSIKDVWINREELLNERYRDNEVQQTLASKDICLHLLENDQLISDTLLTKTQQPFRVFTAYYRTWLQTLHNQQPVTPYPCPSQQGPATATPSFKVETTKAISHWLLDEAAVQTRLHTFCDQQLSHYNGSRDQITISGTSLLSPYLANGQLGPRRIVSTIQLYAASQQREWSEDAWLRQLAWRDFYKQLPLHFPDICRGKPFKPNSEISWRQSLTLFTAWSEGKTGYPLIDAAMRQLQRTHWMHNRLRMLTASFLCKLLRLDWRLGEKFFLKNLVDGEFAANNASWQWSAATGCDAAPYFRIFNPERQSAKFDSDGTFIRHFVPELASVTGKQIHNPSTELRQQCGYPDPIIDYVSSRAETLKLYQD